MEIVLYYSQIVIFSVGTFIVYELFRELGFWTWIVEVIYTSPKFDNIITIIGDTIFGVAIGVLSSVGFYYYTDSIIAYKVIIYAIIALIIGSTLKEYFRK